MNFKKLVSVSAAAALVACGGSSKPKGPAVAYSGPTGTIAIDSTSKIGLLATAFTGAVGGFSGIGTGGASALGAAGAGPRVGVKAALARAAALRAQASPAVLTGVVQSAKQNCDGGGSISGSMNDQDGNPDTTQAGDWVQITYDACKDANGNTGYGSIRIDILRTDGADFMSGPDLMTAGIDYSARLTIDDFATVDATGYLSGVDGDATLSLRTVGGTDLVETMTGSHIASVEGSAGKITAAFLLTGPGGSGGYSMGASEYYGNGFYSSATEADSDFDGRMCSTEIGGCIDVVTNPAFSQRTYESYPYTGTIKISDGRGAFVQLAATSGTGSVDVTYDLDGTGGNPPVGPISTTWPCLETEADAGVCLQ